MIYQNGLKIASFRPKDRLIEKNDSQKAYCKMFFLLRLLHESTRSFKHFAGAGLVPVRPPPDGSQPMWTY